MCASVQLVKGVEPAREEVEAMAADALRTLAIAYGDSSERISAADAEQWTEDRWREFADATRLRLVGVVGIQDPVRPEVPRRYPLTP